MGKPKDIAWGQVDIDPKNESVVCCKHCKAKLFIGSGRNQSVSAVKKHLKAQHFPVFSSLYPSGYRDCGILEWNPVPFPIPSRTRIPSRYRFLRDTG